MASPSRVIHTVLRLADDHVVPIELIATSDGWLRAVLPEGAIIKHCRRSHVLLPQTTYFGREKYMECIVCARARAQRFNKKWHANNREKHNADMKRWRMKRAA